MSATDMPLAPITLRDSEGEALVDSRPSVALSERVAGAAIVPLRGGQPAAPEEARARLEEAASLGDVDAMFNLGMLLQPTDAASAWRWWDRAAMAGHVEAMNVLGSALRLSYPEVARPLLETAAAAEHTGAMNQLGLLLLACGDDAGMRWLEEGAARGDTDAQTSLRAVCELGVMGALKALGSLREADCASQFRLRGSAPASRSAAAMSIQPELWAEPAGAAVAFYEAAFGATVILKLGAGNDTVAELRLGDAVFWVSAPSPSIKRVSPKATWGTTSRIRLVVEDPERVIAQARAAGARQTSAVVDDRGWRHGRIVDPFGHEWEIGRPLGG